MAPALAVAPVPEGQDECRARGGGEHGGQVPDGGQAGTLQRALDGLICQRARRRPSGTPKPIISALASNAIEDGSGTVVAGSKLPLAVSYADWPKLA